MKKWDRVYREEPYDYRPNVRCVEWIARMPVLAGGRALDLACGGGRNTLPLAAAGWTVDAWDSSAPGLALLRSAAAERGLADRVFTRQVDLEAQEFSLPPATWDLVISLYYLHRPLLVQIPQALRAGGWVFVETILDAGRGRQRSKNPAHKLQPGELAGYFAGCSIVHHQEDLERGFTTLVARRV